MISHGDVWEKLVHTTEKAIPGSLQAWELVVCLIPGPQSPRTGDADGAVLIEPTGLRSPGATRPVPPKTGDPEVHMGKSRRLCLL